MAVGFPMCADASDGPDRKTTATSQSSLHPGKAKAPLRANLWRAGGTDETRRPLAPPILRSSGSLLRGLPSLSSMKTLKATVAMVRISQLRLRQRTRPTQTQARLGPRVGKAQGAQRLEGIGGSWKRGDEWPALAR